MNDTQAERPFLAANPLVPAAGLFLLGVAGGRWGAGMGGVILAVAVAAWVGWVVAELRGWRMLAQGALGVGLVLGGAGVWVLNQNYVEADHVVRWTSPEEERVAAVRAVVLVAPGESAGAGGGGAYGNRHWLARVRQVWTQHGWAAASGDVMVQSMPGAELQAGMEVEVYGWLARPAGPMNPGAIDPQALLAADRVFVQMRVPRASGVVVRDATAARGAPLVTRMREYLRGKLLGHLIQEDVPAAQALTALLLGYRDPAMADVTQAFTDAGVAHLLAISGSHIVFFTALVWGVLRFVPLRPRWREVLIAGVVGLYVLATPCGPPIMRAAVALGMVVAARMLGRPRAYLNMVAAAAVVVVLLRPRDLLDAGFQLSFVTTAGLILFSARVHGAIFGGWLARLTLVAELSRSRWARWRLRGARGVALVLTANVIGAGTAVPLVAYHFGQANLWAVLAGLAALPIVSVAMVVAAVQLLLELVGGGALLSWPAAFVGRAMIWLVGVLAQLPGAAMPLRAPPGWVVMCLYAALLVWALRRRLAVSRAVMVNVGAAAAVLVAAWYALTLPVGAVRLTALSVGDGSCLVLRTPGGEVWVIDAGAAQGSSLLSSALQPALRVAGVRRVEGQIVTALDVTHARAAGAVLEACRPGQVWVSGASWERREETLAGVQVASAAVDGRVPVWALHAGDVLDLGGGCRLHVLWPPAAGDNVGRRGLILRLEYQGRRVLLADPAAAGALALLPAEACDAVVFTGVERGAGDAAVRRAIAGDGARSVIWCGRGAWATGTPAEGEWNTEDGAVAVELTEMGVRVGRAGE